MAPTKRMTRSPSGALDPQTQALIENLEILNGARGKGLDRAVLVRDLVDLDLAKVKVGAGGVMVPTRPGTGGGIDGGDTQVDPPEVPRGVKASGGFSTILVEWDKPSYSGHAYTEILRSASDDFSTAVRLSTTAANLISDQVGYGKTYYYWVRFVNLIDIKGPVQSTNGVRGQTQEDIGDILDKLQGQIDESFLTPEFNSKLVNMEGLTQEIPILAIQVGDLSKDVGDLSREIEEGLITLEGKVLAENSMSSNLLAEAILTSSTGLDREGYKRRKVSAEIKLTQKVLVTEVGAMAQQILEIVARADSDYAQILENKTSIIRLDADTKLTIEAITQRLDSQKSEIDGNTATITTNSQTILRVDRDLAGVATNVESITAIVTKQTSDIEGNTASIVTNSQTIVTQGNKIDQTIADLANLDSRTTQAITAITVTSTQQKSEIDANTAKINTIDQTLVVVGQDIAGNTTSITSLTDRVTSQESIVGANSATISSHSQTLVQQGGKIDKAIVDLNLLDERATSAISSLTTKVDSQQSEIEGNTASITSQSQTLVVIGNDVNGNKISIASLTDRVNTQQSAINDNKASITSQSQTLVQQGGKIDKNILDIANLDSNTTTAISSLTSKIDTQKSNIDANTASINTQSQTLVVLDNAIKGNKASITSLTDVVNSQQSVIDSNTASITSQSQTLVQQGGKLDQAIADIAGLDTELSQGISSLSSRIDSQTSQINQNTAGITSTNQTLVVIGNKVDTNSSNISGLNGSITSITNRLDTQQSLIQQNSATITSQGQTIITVSGVSDAANAKAEDAKNTATSAASQAAIAAGIAEGKGKVIIQSSTPLSADRLPQNLWIDTTDNKNTPKRWNGTTWLAVTDKAATDAAAAAVVAKNAADAAAAAAVVNAQQIQVVSETLSQLQSKVNTNTASITTNSQTIVTVQNTANSASSAANAANSNAIAAQGAADSAAAAAAAAAGIANGKGKVIIQPTAPNAADRLPQNLWIDTNGNANTPKRWSGTAWVAVTDKAATDAAAAAVTAKNAADAAQSTANSAAAAAVVAKTAADNAQSSANAANANANTANALLTDIANDNKITPSEKQDAKKEWDVIASEKTKIEAEGNKFSVSVAAYNTAYSALNTYITPLIVPLTGTTDINGATFRSKFKDYYDARQDLLNAITTKAKALADAAQSAANTNGQQITVMAQQLTTLTSDLNGTKSQVTQNSQTIAAVNATGGSAYQAQWGVKASIGDIVAGIGLTVKKETGKPDITQCTVIAGQFSVGVASTTGAATVYPFIVANHPTTGIPGVFIDTAYIKAANVQDLVAGEVVADNIKVGATLTAPYIKGGRIEIGSKFTVDENGNMVANNAIMTNATVSGTINASAGVFSNVTINENCDVKGTVYANKIVGDVYNAFNVSVPANSPGNNQTIVAYSGTIPKQNFARKVEFGGVYIFAGAGAGAVGKFYLNNALVYSFDIVGASGGSVAMLPGYITTLAANTDAVMRMDIFTGLTGIVISSGVTKIAAFKA